ncbi:Zeta toxin [compost metagenome]
MTFPLLQQLQESVNDRSTLKAIFVAGIPAAGKSYTVSQISDGAIPLCIVNTDNVIEFFHRKGLIDMRNKSEQRSVLDQAKKTTKEQLFHWLNGTLPLIIDSTSSNEQNIIRRKGLLQSLGYDVAMVWVNVDVETAVARAAKRDRAVDEAFIRRSYEVAEENKEYFRGNFNNFVEVDNAGGAIDASTLAKAVKAASSFLGAEVGNPTGKRLKKNMAEKQLKYLVPGVYDEQQLRSLVESWYK